MSRKKEKMSITGFSVIIGVEVGINAHNGDEACEKASLECPKIKKILEKHYPIENIGVMFGAMRKDKLRRRKIKKL